MKIKLEGNSPFFFIKDVIHLSFEKPGPEDLDITKLTQEQKRWLLQAVNTRQISISEGSVSELSVPLPTIKISEVKTTEMSNIEKQLLIANKEKIDCVTKLLFGTNTKRTIKEIDKVSDVSVLRLAKDTELGNRKRERIVDAIDLRLKEIFEEVSKKVGIPDYSDVDKTLPEVEEVIEKEVTVEV